MELNGDQLRRANMLFECLSKQPEHFFLESPIYKCDTCEGTGLQAQRNEFGCFSWDTRSFCDDCSGTGHKGLSQGMQIDDTHYICHNCNGIGCSACNQGIVDWVGHAMG